MLEERLFAQYKLTPQQYNALRLLRGEHPEKIRTLDLAARLVSHAPDVTRLLDKLEQSGLVERDRPADNRRVVRIGITEAGLALLQELREPVRECHARQLGHLSQKELKDLTALLRAARLPHEEPSSNWR
jgi:DNA-binding MarR family transcriptional regulator